MPSLAELQNSIARRLTGDPAAESDPWIARVLHSLHHKRMTAAAQLLPGLRRVLGSGWSGTFRAHAAGYTPCGLLYHVDNAFEFALSQSRSPDPTVRQTARQDLKRLRSRWVRKRARGAYRVRERSWRTTFQFFS